MDIFSSVVLAIVFLSGASVGALITAVCRYAARNAIQRDFQARLVGMAEQQASQTSAHASGDSEATRRVLEESSPEDFDDVEDEEDFAWIASHRPTTTGSDALRL